MLNCKPNSGSATCKRNFWLMILVVILAMLVYQLNSLEPSLQELSLDGVAAPPLQLVGFGVLLGPEDIAYDAINNMLYTGCADGWIKTVSISDLRVNNWVYTGGRPLGLTVGNQGQLLVADANRGLLRVNRDRTVELLSDEVEGLKFRLTDAVHVAQDDMIYFTDASYKYRLNGFIFDILEGEPHGRLMSFNPKTRETTLLADNLYFANGVVVSPDQNYVIVCETPKNRCNKYYIRGNMTGCVDTFVDQLPGMPDKINYDGHGHYHIALTTIVTHPWNEALKNQFIIKVFKIIKRCTGWPYLEINGGIYVVDLEGKPVAHYHGLELLFISSGIKVGSYLYCGSIVYPYIIRFNLNHQLVIDLLNTK